MNYQKKKEKWNKFSFYFPKVLWNKFNPNFSDNRESARILCGRNFEIRKFSGVMMAVKRLWKIWHLTDWYKMEFTRSSAGVQSYSIKFIRVSMEFSLSFSLEFSSYGVHKKNLEFTWSKVGVQLSVGEVQGVQMDVGEV